MRPNGGGCMLGGFLDIYFYNNYGFGFILDEIYFAIVLNFILNHPTNNKKDIIRKIIEVLVGFLLISFIGIIYATILRGVSYYDAAITVVDATILTFTVLLVLYNIFALKLNPIKQIIISTLFLTMFYAESAFAGWLGTMQEFYWHILPGIEFTLVSNILMLIVITLFLFFYDFRKISFIPKTNIVLASFYLIFIFSNLSIIRLYFLKIESIEYNNIFFAVYIFYVLFALIIYLNIYYSSKSYSDKIYERVILDYSKSYIQMMDISEKSYQQIRKINHDIKNQFAMLNLLLENQQYDELKKYLSKYQSEYSKAKSLIQCGNQVIDNILNIEINKCITNNIKLQQEILVPSELNINPIDLCSLLSNIIDNSIDAVAKLTERQKIITLKIKYINDYLIITATNPTNKEFTSKELSSIKTTKSDKENHGYGLKIIQAICKKYNGHFELNYQNHNFIVSIMIECKGEANEKRN